jgi:hypothetical protein
MDDGVEALNKQRKGLTACPALNPGLKRPEKPKKKQQKKRSRDDLAVVGDAPRPFFHRP